MRKTLDIYIRAHGAAERNSRMLHLENFSEFSLFSYCPSGGLLSAEAADSLIFNRVCKNLDSEKREKVLELTQAKNVIQYLSEGFSALTESFFPVRKGRTLSVFKEKMNSFLNYEIDWRDFYHITAIIAHDTNSNVYVWIPKHNMDNIYYSKLRNLLSPEYFPRDLSELIGQIQDSKHFLGKVACQYDHVNLHWSLCRYVYSKNDPEWELNKGKFGHVGDHDSRRLNEILVLTAKKRENLSVVSRRNSI